jgi:hypothetical protein
MFPDTMHNVPKTITTQGIRGGFFYLKSSLPLYHLFKTSTLFKKGAVHVPSLTKEIPFSTTLFKCNNYAPTYRITLDYHDFLFNKERSCNILHALNFEFVFAKFDKFEVQHHAS